MRATLISVIIPVYNAEKYLKETIQSVLKQIFIEFEIIAVNDGSTDSSLKILKQFSDDRIRIINKVNTGVSDTRNIALAAAKGEYVCFLDADDYYSPNYLQRMVTVVEKNNADMVICNYVPFRGKPDFSDNEKVPSLVPSAEFLNREGVLTPAWTKLVKKSILSKYNIVFDKNISFGEDLFFCWKVLLASTSVWYIDEKLYGYRMTDSGATNKFHPNLYEKYKAAFDELKKFGKAVGKDNEYEMDVFFTTRIPSFIRMTIREKQRILHKISRLRYIISDNIIKQMLYNFDSFSKHIPQSQILLYKNCRNENVTFLMIYGYIEALKDKLRRIKSQIMR